MTDSEIAYQNELARAERWMNRSEAGGRCEECRLFQEVRCSSWMNQNEKQEVRMLGIYGFCTLEEDPLLVDRMEWHHEDECWCGWE